MEAQADIITDDLRLIERFFMPLKKIFKEGFESQPEKIADNLLWSVTSLGKLYYKVQDCGK